MADDLLFGYKEGCGFINHVCLLRNSESGDSIHQNDTNHKFCEFCQTKYEEKCSTNGNNV